ncbi:TPA: hypothetical protein TZS69_000458 [Streptococcus suis]|nr:hypothetical protein [Streptococcus suis]
MVMILRTLLFPVDNGMGTGLSGDGYSAEYDLWTGKVRWRKAAEGSISKQQELTFRLLVLSSILSPIVVAGLLLFSRNLFQGTKILYRDLDKYAPIILGIVLFLAFETLMLAIRRRDPIVQVEPSLKNQHEYFEKMFDFSIKKNISGRKIPPYVTTYLASFSALLCIPLSYYVYLNPENFSDTDYGSIVTLLVTSVFVSLLPNVMWNLIIKHIIYLKLIRKTNGK